MFQINFISIEIILNYLLLTSLVGLIIYFTASKLKFLNDKNRHKFKISKAVVVGGLIILVNLLISIKFFEFPKIINEILIYSIPIFLLGFFDDLKPIPVTSRIFFQFIIIFFVITENQLIITNLGKYQSIGMIELGSTANIFTTMCIILIMNSFNYNDGIDGWSNLNFINSNLFLIILMFTFDAYKYINIPLIFIFSCLTALVLNFGLFKSTKIFLGNGGSLILGYLLSMELILITKNSSEFHPILIASILSYNVYEFMSANFHRVFNRINLFKGGKDHLHYAIHFYFKNNIFISLVALLFIQTLITFLNIFIYFYYGQLITLFSYIVLFLIYFKLRNYFININKLN